MRLLWVAKKYVKRLTYLVCPVGEGNTERAGSKARKLHSHLQVEPNHSGREVGEPDDLGDVGVNKNPLRTPVPEPVITTERDDAREPRVSSRQGGQADYVKQLSRVDTRVLPLGAYDDRADGIPGHRGTASNNRGYPRLYSTVSSQGAG